MALTIPESVLKEAGLTEREALIEIACRLFEAERLTLWSAMDLAGMSQEDFVRELGKRRIRAYTPSEDDVRRDLEALRRLEQ